MTDLTPIIEALIALIATLVSAFLIPWLHKHTTAMERDNLLVWVDIAVRSAQQLYYMSDGETRLQHALEMLSDRGFDVSDDVVRDAIEAAVLRLHREMEAA